jgi:glycosyltransferase involved in cell wall biosynthesis
MANAIIRLLKDNELRDTISKNNIREFKTKFDIIGVAKSTTSIYQNLIEKYNTVRG